VGFFQNSLSRVFAGWDRVMGEIGGTSFLSPTTKTPTKGQPKKKRRGSALSNKASQPVCSHSRTLHVDSLPKIVGNLRRFRDMEIKRHQTEIVRDAYGRGYRKQKPKPCRHARQYLEDSLHGSPPCRSSSAPHQLLNRHPIASGDRRNTKTRREASPDSTNRPLSGR
jgi:hypothetical protein